MISCKNCGVRLDEHMNFCPVCGVMVINIERNENLEKERTADSLQLRNEIRQLNKREKSKLLWEVISIVLAAAIVSTMILNFIISNSLNWSLYVLVGSLTIFLFTSVFAFQTSLKLLSVFIISIISMILLDIINKPLDWSYQLGIPLLTAGWAIFLLLFTIIKNTQEKGFNLIAYTFIGVSLLALAVQWIISLYKNEPNMDWSLVVFFSILPVVIVLLYFHYKLRKGTNLRKFFHI